jgi:acetyl-CoA C-acetyltransferase
MGTAEPHPVFYHRTALSTFALRATSYFDRYGLSPEEGKRMIAKIAVKNRRQGSLSPKAHFQREITLDEALNSPTVCWPLSLTDCCPVTDGAAAAILTRADMAKGFRDDYMLIKALAEASGPGADYGSDEFDLSHFEEVCRAAQDAYRQAGIKDPFNEVDLAQCHDCFSSTEAILYEDLGLCPRGEAKRYVDEGIFEADGKVPMNTDGGLLSFGHPLGASGIRQAYEMYKQFQGKAGLRQLKDPKIGMCENFGGGYGAWAAIVNIYGRPD